MYGLCSYNRCSIITGIVPARGGKVVSILFMMLVVGNGYRHRVVIYVRACFFLSKPSNIITTGRNDTGHPIPPEYRGKDLYATVCRKIYRQIYETVQEPVYRR